MSGHNKTIPEPSGYRMLTTCSRRMMSLPIGEIGVVYDNNETRIAFCITTAVRLIVAGLLDKAMRGVTPAGREVVAADVSCGGVLPYDVEVTGSLDEVAAVREAITHVYASETGREARQALRSIYRHLGKVVTS